MPSRPGYLKHIKRDAEFENETILCKCGCGTQIERYWKDTKGYWWERFYIRGHIRRGMKNSEKQKEAARNLVTSPDWHKKLMKGIRERNSDASWIDSVSSASAAKRWVVRGKNHRDIVTCSYCEKEIIKVKSDLVHRLSFCNRECSSLYHSKDNHPFYSGGIRGYPREWKKSLKEKIIERDGGKCVICAHVPEYQNLSVHHIDENKENCDDVNLVSLCRKCHRKVHNKTVALPEKYLSLRVL